MNVAQLRSIAERIVYWRRRPSGAFFAGVPLRLLADPRWRERHLLAPRERILRREREA